MSSTSSNAPLSKEQLLPAILAYKFLMRTHSAWFTYEDRLDVYLRFNHAFIKGFLVEDNGRCSGICISNVNRREGAPKGSFIKLVADLAQAMCEVDLRTKNSDSYLYVENVATDYLAEHLKKNGWTAVRAPNVLGMDLGDRTSYYAKASDLAPRYQQKVSELPSS